MKKQHLDPEAVRDFSVLDQMDRNRIAAWLMDSNKHGLCPLNSCGQCRDLFPEIAGKTEHGLQKHPCNILYVKNVILIAEQAVAWKQKTNGNI